MRGAFGDEICANCKAKNNDICLPPGYFRPTTGKTYLVDPPLVASRCTHPKRKEAALGGATVYETIIPFVHELYNKKHAGAL